MRTTMKGRQAEAAANWIGRDGRLGEATVRERVRERENRVSEGKKSGRNETKKGAEILPISPQTHVSCG